MKLWIFYYESDKSSKGSVFVAIALAMAVFAALAYFAARPEHVPLIKLLSTFLIKLLSTGSSVGPSLE